MAGASITVDARAPSISGSSSVASVADHDDHNPFLSAENVVEADVSASDARSRARQERRRSDYLVGILLLLLVVLLWTGSNFLTNSVLTHGYDKPWAVTYFNTSSFLLYLFPFVLLSRGSDKRNGHLLPRQAAHVDDAQPIQEKWWERLGFKLPGDASLSLSSQIREGRHRRDGYAQLVSSPVAQVRPLPEDAPSLRGRGHLRRDPSLEALRPSFVSRPSSIDGRRPASVINPSTRPATSQNAVDDRDELSHTQIASPGAPPLLPLTLRETLRLSLQFTFVWFLANYTLNAGLGLTSVASGTTLSSASGFFTLALGSIFAVETFTWTKLAAVGVSFAGVTMVTWADSGMRAAGIEADSAAGLVEGIVMLAKRAATEGPPPLNAFAGDLLALASAFFYAVYVTLLKVRIQSEDRVSMPLFFGFVGLFNIVLLWPFGLLLHLTGVEPFSWPQDRMTWLGVAVNMAITLVSDFAYLLAMLKSSPLIATVGLSLTIPLAVMGDIAKGSHSGGAQAIIGSAMVLLSFVVIGLADNALIDDPSALTDREADTQRSIDREA